MRRALGTVKPTKMWVDGKCFELGNHPQKLSENEGQCTRAQQYEIGPNEHGKLFTSFRLPQLYYTKLLEFRYLDLIQLEKDTNTTISVPKSGNLLITGHDVASIINARDNIQTAVGAIRDHTKALQFVSIPTLSEEIRDNFRKFKDEILSGEKIQGIEESIFINPDKLHLTVVVFALLDDYETAEATKALQDYKISILDPLIQEKGPIKIRISGIDCMNPNHKKVDVLYAKAAIVNEQDDFTLQKLVNELSDHFYERGLVRTYQDNVKLHMTLINTKYRKCAGSPKKKQWARKVPFNATTIMEKYKDFTFGECNLDSIHISLMGSVGDDGFYRPVAIISTKT